MSHNHYFIVISYLAYTYFSVFTDNKAKTKTSSSKHEKKTKHTSKKHNVSISNSQKEERKRKLKEIANKEKGEYEKVSPKTTKEIDKEIIKLPASNTNFSKTVANVKVTSSSRQAFLSESIKSVKKKESPQKSSAPNGKKHSSSPKVKPKVKSPKQLDNIENTKNLETIESKSKHNISKISSKDSKNNLSNKTISNNIIELREPLKSLKPVIASINTKIGTQPQKKKKKVHFSEDKPEIHYFEIEDGNKMKKTSLVKTSLVDVRQMPIFSLEKITLMKILRWNPHWLEEQINNNEPPPILGHNNPPLAIFHSFVSHNQYVQ